MISPVQNNVNISKRATNIGTAAGFGIGGIYIAKNGKDIFNSAMGAVSNQANKNKAVAVAAGVCVAIVGGITLVGRAIGAITGKIIDKINEKKVAQAVLANMLSETIKTIKTDDRYSLTLEEFEALPDGSKTDSEEIAKQETIE